MRLLLLTTTMTMTMTTTALWCAFRCEAFLVKQQQHRTFFPRPVVRQQQQQQQRLPLAVSTTPNEVMLNQPQYNSNNESEGATTATQTKEKKKKFITLESDHPADMPVQGEEDGIYHVLNQAQHAALLAAAADKIVVLKCFAPWCRACKGLEPKFLQLSQNPKYNKAAAAAADNNNADLLPIVWADLSIQHNKEFVKSLGVLALPTIQFYVAGQLIDTFACGPSKVPILKRKLANLINEHVDATTHQLKQEFVVSSSSSLSSSATAGATATATAEQPETKTAAAAAAEEEKVVKMTPKQRKLFDKIPYFKDMSIADVDDVLENRAVLKTFAPGTVMIREGDPGRSFFVLQKGEVELCREITSSYNSYADPLVATPPSYLGTVVNVLHTPGDYFGERALITGEPAAASVRAATPVQAWVLDRSAFPASSVLSGQTKGSADMVSTADDKYGVIFSDDDDDDNDVALFFTNKKWQEELVKANQVRGSVNTPELIRGVDTPDEIADDYEEDEEQQQQDDLARLPLSMQEAAAIASSNKESTDAILSLLSQFQLIRRVSRCFDYIMQTQATWGDEGVRKRRSMLVSRLSPAQRAEFVQAFRLIDADGDGDIELIELKRVEESIGEDKTDEELAQMIAKGSRRTQLDARSVISLEDFLGIMAEAEFYHLFRDIFAALDKDDTGYVKAKEMCRVLKGVRDLISDDRSRTIIDVEDEEMLIDYEQFSRMLLGSTLA